MKKLLIAIMLLCVSASLVACKTDDSEPSLPSDPLDVDLNATYRTSIASTSSMNQHSETLANASTLNALITTPLYMGDYDWDKAIELGLASEKGDFSQTDKLPHSYFPSAAKSLPIDVSDEGSPGTKWRIELRDDMKFEDETKITADTYAYSWRMLIDPLLLNRRASNIYDSGNLPLKNAQAYFRQGKPIPETDPEEFYPEVKWEDVGFKVISDYVFEIELSLRKTQWQVMGQMTSAITSAVHPEKYEAGMNEERTRTSYGTYANPTPSFGPYNLATWEDEVLFIFTRNDNHPHADQYRIKHIRFDVIDDQSLVVSEFRAGRLNVAGVAGEYYNEFKDNPNLKLEPRTTFGRLAINQGQRPGGAINPLLKISEFRKALYHGLDRETFANEVRMPSLPVQGIIGPVYRVSETDIISYRDTIAGKKVLEDLFPETYGYNPNLAKQLFDQAYQKAVSAGDLSANEVAEVEFVFFDAEANWVTANWIKDSIEEVFNVSGQKRFNLKLTALSSDALNAAVRAKNYDLTLHFWQGMDFWPASLMGYVYNSTPPWDSFYMREGGFKTGELEIEVNLKHTKNAVVQWINELNSVTSRELTDSEIEYLEAFELFVETISEANVFKTTFDGAFSELVNYIMDYVQDYEGRDEDLANITAAMEKALLDLMINIPLFSAPGVTVFSSNVVHEAQAYHIWMGWGGYRYMYMKKTV